MAIHRARVVENRDPRGLGRLQVVVPTVTGDAPSWAVPVVPLGAGPAAGHVPIGTIVWVMFEGDDVDSVVVLGQWPADAAITPVEPATELGQVEKPRAKA